MGPGWSLPADRVEPQVDGGWRALIGVRRGLALEVRADRAGSELMVDAWAGEPAQSEGVAVVAGRDGAVGVAPVPQCSCGDYGCSNSGIQFSKELTPADLPVLVEYLRGLPWSTVAPTRGTVLCGDGVAALSEPEAGLTGYSQARRQRPGRQRRQRPGR